MLLRLALLYKHQAMVNNSTSNVFGFSLLEFVNKSFEVESTAQGLELLLLLLLLLLLA